jgi:hypothetical protein
VVILSVIVELFDGRSSFCCAAKGNRSVLYILNAGSTGGERQYAAADSKSEQLSCRKARFIAGTSLSRLAESAFHHAANFKHFFSMR